jgi:hypothetical protein
MSKISLLKETVLMMMMLMRTTNPCVHVLYKIISTSLDIYNKNQKEALKGCGMEFESLFLFFIHGRQAVLHEFVNF